MRKIVTQVKHFEALRQKLISKEHSFVATATILNNYEIKLNIKKEQ